MSKFTVAELAKLRTGLLEVINTARRTSNYRGISSIKDKVALYHADSQKFVDIPSNLPNLLNGNTILNDMAQWLADDNAEQKKTSHTGSKDGYVTQGDRASKFGYNNSTRNTNAQFLAEACSSAGTGKETQDGATYWLTSTSHFRPFFSKDGDVFTHIGLGFAKGNDNNTYIVAVFGNPAGLPRLQLPFGCIPGNPSILFYSNPRPW